MGRILPFAVAVSLLAGCAISTHPRIADIRHDPGRYQRHSITIEGVVTSSWGLPLAPIKLYKVDDGSGEVTVVAHDGRTPPKGSRVSVKGRVSEVAEFGRQSVGLHLEQEHLKFRR
jgi:hypothetical protein